MKVRNKKTGEIIILIDHIFDNYKNLDEFKAEWEDYEEPKTFFTIYYDGTISEFRDGDDEQIRDMKEIGNYFETREEAERAVEKLKAWKRLKDKGFRFSEDWVYRFDKPMVKNHTYFEFVAICEDGIRFDDLDLLFGGEE